VVGVSSYCGVCGGYPWRLDGTAPRRGYARPVVCVESICVCVPKVRTKRTVRVVARDGRDRAGVTDGDGDGDGDEAVGRDGRRRWVAHAVESARAEWGSDGVWVGARGGTGDGWTGDRWR